MAFNVPLWLPVVGIEAESDQVVAQRDIVEHVRGDGAAVPLARQRRRPGRPLAAPVRDRQLGAGHNRLIRGGERVPLLAVAAQREVRGEEVRLVEIEPDAAVE